MTDRSGPTMQPLMVFRFLAPSRRGLKQFMFLLNKSLTRVLVKTPCIMAKPCLSLPPPMRTTYPANSSPRQSAGTSVAIPKEKYYKDRLLIQKHTLIEEWHELIVIINLEALLLPSDWIRNVKLHFKDTLK